MPRPTLPLDGLQDAIHEQVLQGANDAELLEFIEQQTGTRPSASTIRRRLREWGLVDGGRFYRRSEITQEVFQHVKDLFLIGLTDNEILVVLRRNHLAIEPRRLQRIRLDESMRLLRRFRPQSEEEVDTEATQLRLLVEQELDKVAVQQLGRRLLWTHFRTLGEFNLPIAQHRLFALVKAMDPEGVHRRLRRIRLRRRYRIPGPNYMWCIDAHDKLDHWGFEIYAGVDAYSRFVVWAYCGVSSHTQFSVFAQYISVVEDHGFFPAYIRSDRGVEMVMAADAHLRLHQRYRPDVTFPEVYRYGTSKQNQRIESWWQQLSRSTLLQWREFFQELEDAEEWSAESLPDRIALMAVYMPILRHQFKSFVMEWNIHRIGRNSKMPHRVTGQPWFLYRYPSDGVQDFKQLLVPQDLVDFKRDIGGYNMNEYLPSETLEWCNESLIRRGYPTQLNGDETTVGGQRLHREAYRYLRGQIWLEFEAGNGSNLNLCAAPTGGRGYQPPELPDAPVEPGLDHLDDEVMAEVEYEEEVVVFDDVVAA